MVEAQQRALADGGERLLLRELGRALCDREDLAAHADCATGHEAHAVACTVPRRRCCLTQERTERRMRRRGIDRACGNTAAASVPLTTHLKVATPGSQSIYRGSPCVRCKMAP